MRRRWGAIVAVVGTALLALLVVMPVAFAATLFGDDFEDGNLNGWTRSGGSWSVVTDGSGVARQSSTSSSATALAGQASWTDYAAQARVRPLAFNGTDRFVALLARAQGSTSYYSLSLRSGNEARLSRVVGGGSTTLAAAPMTVSTGTWYTLRLEVDHGSLRASVNGAVVATATDTQFSGGRVGLGTANASAEFDDVQVDTIGGGGPTPTPLPSASPTPVPSASPTPVPDPTPSLPPPPPGSPVGFASVAGLGLNGTTGGAGGPTVTATTSADFLRLIATPGPMVIRVQGMLTLPGPMHDVTSDKTIIGVGASSGLTGGGLNIGLPIDDGVTSPPVNAVRNVIVRNLVVTNCPDDCINVQMFSHHVWIDHDDLSFQHDGALDIKRGSDLITVSWVHFHDSDKNSLLGHDDSNGPQDIGRLRVTYHHNFFDGSVQRNPRVRFGEPVHVFNNYYFHNTGYGVASQMNAGVVVEGNFFDTVKKPTRVDVGGDPGRIVQRLNVFVSSDPPVAVGSVVEPRTFYSYTLDNAADVPSIVRAGAGTGKIGA